MNIKKFESNVQYTKYLVNKEITERFINGTLDSSLDEIAEKLVPGPKPVTRCCIYKERHIIKERAKNAIEPLKGTNVINILHDACDECPVNRFMVTEACRGCLAHKCVEACPKDAIYIVNQHAYINQNLCIECGRCHAACPFNAISDVQRPCIRSCEIGAIKIDEDRKAYIDDSKCVSCGACTVACSTCTCFTTTDIIYNENANVGERKRTTASCQVEGFDEMAGGMSFRHTAGDRMRYKVLHKFHDYKARFKDYHMCVGCGRCIDRCPEFISIVATVNKMAKAIDEITGTES